MIKIQVVFGAHTEADARCRRCGGTGTEHGAFACIFCGGDGMSLPGRRYTYLAPDGTELWEQMQVVANGETKRVTVVSLTSEYEGALSEAYPLPRTTKDCPGCVTAEILVRSPCCRMCMARLPEELLEGYGAALREPGTFKRVGALLRIQNWLRENPA